MKLSNLILLMLSLLIASCASEPDEETQQRIDHDVPHTDESIDLNQPIIPEAFFYLFKFNNELNYDFGWRYLPQDTIEGVYTTFYDQAFAVDTITLQLEGDDTKKIFLEGFAHSFVNLPNENFLLICYVPEEISEHFKAFELDDQFNTLSVRKLASAGGDEGSWFHRFGTFKEDYSQYNYVESGGQEAIVDYKRTGYFQFD